MNIPIVTENYIVKAISALEKKCPVDETPVKIIREQKPFSRTTLKIIQ